MLYEVITRIEAQHSKGRLTARERIELLMDEGSFEEFDLLMTGRNGSSVITSYSIHYTKLYEIELNNF